MQIVIMVYNISKVLYLGRFVNFFTLKVKGSEKRAEESLDVEYRGERFSMKTFLKFLKDEEGQTSTEYILLVAVVALIVFKFKGVAEEKLTKITNGVFEKAEGFVDGIQ